MKKIIIESEDRDFKFWLNFFKQDKPNLNKFRYFLSCKDTYFLNHNPLLDFDDEDYEKTKTNGFLEFDIQNVLLNENPKDKYYKTRLAIAIYHNIDLEIFKNTLSKEKFEFVLERVLIDGEYEYFSIPFEKLLSLIIKKEWVPKDVLFDWSILRGMNQASIRTDNQEAALKAKINFYEKQLQIYKKNNLQY